MEPSKITVRCRFVRGGAGFCSLAVVLGSAPGAPGQVPEAEMGWHGIESYSGTGTDKGVDLAYYDEGETKWVYVAGYVTQGSATRLAVWRYDAEAPFDEQPLPFDKRALFPPEGGPTPSGQTRATAIYVTTAGDVYVVGQTPIEKTSTFPTFGSDLNYVMLRYNPDLTIDVNAWAADGNQPAGCRIYDGPDHLDDVAVDVVLDEAESPGPFVYVTGNSDDASSGLDIVTIKIDQDGDFSDTWATQGEGVGVRRFNRDDPIDDGDDTAAAMGYAMISDGDETLDNGPAVFIAGTSHNGSNNDIVILAYDSNGKDGANTPNPAWVRFHNGGDEDVAHGLATRENGDVYIGPIAAGYSVVSGNTDFVTIARQVNGDALWTETWNGPENGTDIAYACAQGTYQHNPRIWVTGRTKDGSVFDAATVCYDGVGDIVCTRVFEWSASTSEYGVSVVANDDANAWVGGNVGTLGLAFRLAVGQTSTCDLVWQTTHPGQSAGVDVPTEVLRIIQTPSGALVTGTAITGAGTDAFSGRYMDP